MGEPPSPAAASPRGTCIAIVTPRSLLSAYARDVIDKIRRGFVWRGHKEAKGGHCLIAWPKVCRAKELEGLGISDLKCLGIALRVR
jgi:hypothetical protein